MARFLWPADDGWPYPDGDDDDTVDLTADADDDMVSVLALASHLYDGLTPLEREVIDARFGLEGHEVLTMQQLTHELGVPGDDLRLAFDSGLDKMRAHLA